MSSAQHLTKDICLTREMLCGHISPWIYVRTMLTLYPSLVFSSGKNEWHRKGGGDSKGRWWRGGWRAFQKVQQSWPFQRLSFLQMLSIWECLFYGFIVRIYKLWKWFMIYEKQKRFQHWSTCNFFFRQPFLQGRGIRGKEKEENRLASILSNWLQISVKREANHYSHSFFNESAL